MQTRRTPGFALFWSAETITAFGAAITGLALQVLVVSDLGGGAAEVGLLSAARWLPYVLVGLVAGALIERWRRKPLMLWSDVARAILLGVIPLLWLQGALTLPVLCVCMALYGLASLVNDGASQAFLPRLVPRLRLLDANARLDTSDAVAQTSGPAVAGIVVQLVGAPLAVLVDALSFLASAFLLTRIRIDEPAPVPERRRLWPQVAEGLRFVYRHRQLAPNAISTHAWFLCNAAIATAFVPWMLVRLELGPALLGLVLAFAGVGALCGSLVSARLGRRFGVGWVVIVARVVTGAAWLVVALAPRVAGDGPALVAVLCTGQLLVGLAMGSENANEMAFRQSVAPDAMQARVNTTIRSINRGMIVIAAPVAGVVADAVGAVPVMIVGAIGLALTGASLAVTPFRTATHD